MSRTTEEQMMTDASASHDNAPKRVLRDEDAPGVVAIAVVATNGVIGDGHDQPFKFPEDWARFKRVTLGHPLIMGRRTHDAMGLLTGRTNIVVSRTPQAVTWPDQAPEGSHGIAVSSIEEALAVASGLDQRIYVIGGGQIYKAAWDWLTDPRHHRRARTGRRLGHLPRDQRAGLVADQQRAARGVRLRALCAHQRTASAAPRHGGRGRRPLSDAGHGQHPAPRPRRLLRLG
ncbi:dihydrofolate reductase [Propionibacterium freudenreichii]|uniref:dihydrofolate reductase n=1 Tax=Propionibacterium freudenreichii TaxID=1744 RepID=UPI00254A0532|nr:dihydrofolate reductase [Propionibacterium freudenreichii]